MTDREEFTAIVVDETADGVTAALRKLPVADLPPGEVTVRITHSDLNYKDGMVMNGIGRLVRAYPHVPGIDFAGTVEQSDSPNFAPGDPVILTGWRVGEAHWGGFATRARVCAEWLLPLPDGMTLRDSMALGTAGLTAMMAVMALEENGLDPNAEGDVLVTGASGGVGGIAVALLAELGYRVVAASGRADAHDYLTGLGAAEVIGREELEAAPRGPLVKTRWIGAVDTVGGQIFANLLAALTPGGSCAALGMAAGNTATVSLLPFLLRGVNVFGIDSSACPVVRRIAAWRRLDSTMPRDRLEAMTTTIGLADVPDWGRRILDGRVRGRTVIDVAKSDRG